MWAFSLELVAKILHFKIFICLLLSYLSCYFSALLQSVEVCARLRINDILVHYFCTQLRFSHISDFRRRIKIFEWVLYQNPNLGNTWIGEGSRMLTEIVSCCQAHSSSLFSCDLN